MVARSQGNAVLSRQAHALWAKTGGRENPQLWEPLPMHMADAAEIARLLWREWLADSVRNHVCGETGLSNVEAETMVTWLAAIHDIGKATPSFQSKVDERSDLVRSTGLRISPRCTSDSHAFMGEDIVSRWLLECGWSEIVAAGYASVVGGHHGSNPNSDDLKRIQSKTRIDSNSSMGDEQWGNVQNELLEWALQESGALSILPKLMESKLPPMIQILLTGIVTMADWIASNADLFMLDSGTLEWADCKCRAADAWERLGLPRRYTFAFPSLDNASLFRARFTHLPKNAQLRPTQEEAVTIARSIQEPSLLIIEESMGGGKTEAALLAGEIIASRFGLGGVAFLLPTQATSNAMFGRVEEWLRQVIQSSEGMRQDLHLLHGKAALNADFMSLPSWGYSWMGDGHSSEDCIVAHQWFGGTKRGPLAPFVVGTIDQLLMASLKTKHAHLRHLGLAGKVVIIDEVHAYDAYMSVYLDRVLGFLGAYGVPVILLSATLPPSRRKKLLDAYKGSLGSGRKRRREWKPQEEPTSFGYPLLSITSANRRAKPMYCTTKSESKAHPVYVDYMNDGDEVLLTYLKPLLAEGGCVCVLRDTVRRAQQTYKALTESLNVEVVLAHSRFIAIDRAARDAELSSKLGRDSSQRPRALVVVGTQVLEQSLDIDFDLLITDIAPVDLILQRMGRLHRHRREDGESLRPAAFRRARCIITGVCDWQASVPEFARGITSIYEPAILMQTIAALRERLGNRPYLEIPTDIAPLVAEVYEHKAPIPDEWQANYQDYLVREKHAIQQKERSAKEWLLPKPHSVCLDDWMCNWVHVTDEARGRATVRDSEESIEVVVVVEDEHGLGLLPWVAQKFGVEPSLGTGADKPPDDVARVAALCTVCLPPAMSRPRIVGEVIDALEKATCCVGWQESRWLRGALPLVLNRDLEGEVACDEQAFRVRYSQEFGIEVQD